MQEGEEYDPKQYDEDFDKNCSEDSLENNFSFELLNNLSRHKKFDKTEFDRSLSHDNELSSSTQSSSTLSPRGKHNK